MKQLIAILSIFIGNLYTFSCDCITPPIESAIERNEVIFIGKLIENIDNSRLFTPSANYISQEVKFHNFEVISYCKGLKLYDTIVSIIDGGHNCDFPFRTYELGDTFLIYAFHNNVSFEHSFLGTHQCARTILLKDISDKNELFFLKNANNWGLEWNKPKRIRPSFIKSIPKKSNNLNPSFETFFIIGLTLNFILSLFILKKLRNR